MQNFGPFAICVGDACAPVQTDTRYCGRDPRRVWRGDLQYHGARRTGPVGLRRAPRQHMVFGGCGPRSRRRLPRTDHLSFRGRAGSLILRRLRMVGVDFGRKLSAGLPQADTNTETLGHGQNLVVKRPALRRLTFRQGQRHE